VRENLATVLLGVIDDCGIASKIEYFVMDNASNNDQNRTEIALADILERNGLELIQ
jgi:hypothetical protein